MTLSAPNVAGLQNTIEMDQIPARQKAMMTWYRKHGRAMPWRRARPNAYHVLVSEFMLQQTQVATATDYFHRFIAALPTLADLAAADEQQVLRLWQGLGYYRRARFLHASAKMIMNDFGGVLPDTAAALRQLPGVGRYAAGALSSIVYGRQEPVVDGNVIRVLSRWLAIDQPIEDTAVQTRMWQEAGELIPADEPGDFNQAMMELGAVVCTPKAPTCLICPMSTMCQACRDGDPLAYPKRRPRKAPTAVTHHIAAVHRRGRYLFHCRPSTGMWSNMWQMPTWEPPAGTTSAKPPVAMSAKTRAKAAGDMRGKKVAGGAGDQNHTSHAAQPTQAADTPFATRDASQAIAHWLQDTFGLVVDGLVAGDAFTHQTTHRAITFQLWRAETCTGRLKPGAGQWRRLDGLDDLPLANPQKTAAAMLGERG